MADDEPVLLSPQTGETLNKFLQRFSDSELRQITANKASSVRWSGILQHSFSDSEQANGALEKILNIIERLNNFERLEHYFDSLEPSRIHLLESLDISEKQVAKIYKFSACGRLLGSTADLGGTALGLWLKESQSSYSNIAFGVAGFFGLLGFTCATSEPALMKNIFDDLMTKLQRDQAQIAPIQRWYQQSNELEDAMRAVFPFDITNDLVRNFSSAGNAEFTPDKLLSTLLRAVCEQDVKLLRNERLIRNLINFTLLPASQDWCEWMIFYRHPVMLDITRILLQLQNSPIRFSLSHTIPALAAGDQNKESFNVWARIGLNFVLIYDAVNSLRSSRLPNVAHAIQQLRVHLASELNALRRIVEFVRSRRNP